MGKLVVASVDGSGRTWLVGGVLSMALHHVGVSIGALTSNTTCAWLQVVVLVAKPGFGCTVNSTLPSPSGGLTFGGRNPARGSVVNCRVSGSTEVKRQVTIPLAVSRPASIRTRRFCAGRRSTPPV